MGNKGSREDFDWVYTDQPHLDRRKEMLAKYPEIKKLMVPDPNFKWIVCFVAFLHMVTCYLIKDLPWKWVFFWAYVVGNYLSHYLVLSIHEISHNMAFGNKNPRWNCYFGMFINLPVGIPVITFFKKYHGFHHRYLAVEGFDVDLPTPLECYLFNTILGKLIWMFLQAVLYTARPFGTIFLPLTRMDIISTAIQLTFNLLIYYFMGSKSLVYMVTSILFTSGLSIIGGHFVAEHYAFYEGANTTSYYGPMNWIALNVGYHVEHHDFPSIPGSKLPLVKKIAPEYYDNLPYHNSWGLVVWNFIFKAEMGLFTRVKRRLEDRPELVKLKNDITPGLRMRTHGEKVIKS